MSDLLNRDAYVKRFEQFLDVKKMRKTPERFAILRCILAFQSHFTIEQLAQSLELQTYHVSRATLYNTLQLMIEARLVRRHVFEGLPKLKEVRDNDFIAFMNARKFTAFTADFYMLYVYGTCNTCARKLKKQKTK